jgi:hypothetical protein
MYNIHVSCHDGTGHSTGGKNKISHPNLAVQIPSIDFITMTIDETKCRDFSNDR